MLAISVALVSNPASRHSIVAATVSADSPKSSALRMTRMAAEDRTRPRAEQDGALTFEVLRDPGAVRARGDAWDELGVAYVDAERDYFLASVETRDDVERPYVVV